MIRTSVVPQAHKDAAPSRQTHLLTAGLVVASGFVATAAHGQGMIVNPQTQTAAQGDMASAIATMCPNLDLRSGATFQIGDMTLPTNRAPDRTPRETMLNTTCANLVFNDPNAAVDADYDMDGNDDILGFNLPQAQLDPAFQSINGEELMSVQSEIGEIQGVQTGNISARLTAVRAGLTGPGISFAGLDIQDAAGNVLALGDLDNYEIVPAQAQTEEGEILNRLGLFVTGGIRFGDKEATGQADGFDFDTSGITFGADYRIDDGLLVGGAVGYSRFDTDFDTTVNSPDGQELDSDSAIISLFSSYFPTDNLFVDGVITLGYSDYDSERSVVVPSTNPNLAPVNDTAEGDFDAFSYGFAADVGYDFNFGAFSVTPIGRVNFLKADIDGFTESPVGGALELQYGDQDASTLTTNLGAEARYPVSTDFGVLVPSIRGEFIHEFLNDNDGVIIQYANDPTGTSAFEVTTEDVDRNYGLVGASLVAQFPNGYAAFVDYSRTVALELFDNQSLNVGLRKNF